MGQRFSTIIPKNNCNYECPVCAQSGKTPNLAGRFNIINEYECKCNGCNTIFEKCRFYKTVVTDAKPEKEQPHSNAL